MITPHEMPTHQVAITGPGPGPVTLHLDGREIRTCTRAVLTLDPERLPTLNLSLLVLTDLKTDVPAHVLLDEPTREALKAMGWTPPEGDDG
jgi:hypothetical protein